MTKEEILSQHDFDVHYYSESGRMEILEAMEEYAKQTAIGFQQFVEKNYHPSFGRYMKQLNWLEHDEFPDLQKEKFLTLEELFIEYQLPTFINNKP